MYRELINALTYMYTTLCRGKGIVRDVTLKNITIGAHSLTEAQTALAEQQADQLTPADRAYLKEAGKIDEQIEEMYIFLNSLEIV